MSLKQKQYTKDDLPKGYTITITGDRGEGREGISVRILHDSTHTTKCVVRIPYDRWLLCSKKNFEAGVKVTISRLVKSVCSYHDRKAHFGKALDRLSHETDIQISDGPNYQYPQIDIQYAPLPYDYPARRSSLRIPDPFA